MFEGQLHMTVVIEVAELGQEVHWPELTARGIVGYGYKTLRAAARVELHR